MADKAGRPPPTIKDDLLKNAESFSFFQAVRLLRLICGEKDQSACEDYSDLRNFLRIRPKLSLGQPSSDIDKIEEYPGKSPSINMTVNFLGLYGESSPLPIFYTEDLMDQVSDDVTVAKDFFDVLNYPLYFLFYRCWTKYRLFLKVSEEKDPQYLEMLYSLIGLGVEEIRENFQGAYQILKYIGLFTQFPKSALGLKTLLADALGLRTLDIVQCIKRKVKIPEDQLLLLGEQGTTLGCDSYLGEEFNDRNGKFRVRVGPVSAPEFQRLLPGGPRHNVIMALIKLYLIEPFETDIEVHLAATHAQPARLGNAAWSRLGRDSWMIPENHNKRVTATYKLT